MSRKKKKAEAENPQANEMRAAPPRLSKYAQKKLLRLKMEELEADSPDLPEEEAPSEEGSESAATGSSARIRTEAAAADAAAEDGGAANDTAEAGSDASGDVIRKKKPRGARRRRLERREQQKAEEERLEAERERRVVERLIAKLNNYPQRLVTINRKPVILTTTTSSKGGTLSLLRRPGRGGSEPPSRQARATGDEKQVRSMRRRSVPTAADATDGTRSAQRFNAAVTVKHTSLGPMSLRRHAASGQSSESSLSQEAGARDVGSDVANVAAAQTVTGVADVEVRTVTDGADVAEARAVTTTAQADTAPERTDPPADVTLPPLTAADPDDAKNGDDGDAADAGSATQPSAGSEQTAAAPQENVSIIAQDQPRSDTAPVTRTAGGRLSLRRKDPSNPDGSLHGTAFDDAMPSKRSIRKLTRLRVPHPLKGTDPFASFIRGWKQRMDPLDLFGPALHAVTETRKLQDDRAYLGVPAFMKFIEGRSRGAIAEDYAFNFKMFIRHKDINSLLESMRGPSDLWWTNPPKLNADYALIYVDTIPVRLRVSEFKNRSEHLLIITGVTPDGRKELLGCIPDYKPASVDVRYWETLCGYLKGKGVQNIGFIIASFRCRYIDLAFKRFFQSSALIFNLIELLRFDSFSLPDEMRKDFMQEASELCDSPDFESAYAFLERMRDKWESSMRDNHLILQGYVDLLKCVTSVPRELRLLLSTHKITGHVSSLLLGNKQSEDYFNDHEEMLAYIFYRYILKVKYEWTDKMGEAVCNLSFSALFDCLRRGKSNGCATLDQMLDRSEREFMAKYLGHSGTGPVFGVTGCRHNGLCVQLDSRLTKLTPSWDTETEQIPNTQEALDDTAEHMSDMHDAKSVAGTEPIEHLNDHDKYVNTNMNSGTGYVQHTDSLSLDGVSESLDSGLYEAYEALDDSELKKPGPSEYVLDYLPVNTVPGMLRPTLSLARKRRHENLKSECRRRCIEWLGESFNFIPTLSVEHYISPIFKVSLKNKYTKRDERMQAKERREKRRLIARKHQNYLKRKAARDTLDPVTSEAQDLADAAENKGSE